MIHKLKMFEGLLRDDGGSMAIETAIIAPILLIMSLGGFEVSQMVARQHELQGGISEATAVALAANLGAETDTLEMAKLLRESLDLSGESVVVTKIYRCDAAANFVNNFDQCTVGEEESEEGEES